jgi:hypothetical protein
VVVWVETKELAAACLQQEPHLQQVVTQVANHGLHLQQVTVALLQAETAHLLQPLSRYID